MNTSLVGLIISIVSLAIALYSLYISRREYLRRKEKDRLREASNELSTVIKGVESVIELAENLSSGTDIWFNVDQLVGAVLKCFFDTKRRNIKITNYIRVVLRSNNQRREFIVKQNADISRALSQIKAGGTLVIETTVKDCNHAEAYIYPGIDFEMYTNALYRNTTIFMLKYGDIAAFFEGHELLETLIDTTLKILRNMIEAALQGFEVEIKENMTSKELALQLYRKLIGYEKNRDEIEKLRKILPELKELKKQITQASY